MRQTKGILALALVGLLVTLTLGLTAAPAGAHPLGNFSINHLVQVRISSGHAYLRYILDQAEIPTFQERGLPDSQILSRKEAEVARALTLTVGGRPATISVMPGAVITHPPGQGGLPLTRVELPLSASIPSHGRLALSDQTFLGRVGWKAIVAQPGSATAVTSSAPSSDPTGGLRSYPVDLLTSPLDQRTATFTVAPGDGKLTAPRGLGGREATTTNRAGDGFAGVFANAAAGKGVLLLLLLAAFGWGAVHALSPGHGKAMVAAYLVGSRGTARHAVALGATVTVTHTAGVFILGAVTLALSRYVLPDQLYPWLNLASGLLVVVIGAGVLRSRLRGVRAGRAAAPGSDRVHPHVHAHTHHSEAHAHLSEAHADPHSHGELAGSDHAHADARTEGDQHAAQHELTLALAHLPHEHTHAVDAGPRGRGEDQAAQGGQPSGHEHPLAHDHSHAHPHAADRVHSDAGHAHVHSHGGRAHSHDVPDRLTPRSLLVMGASAGLIPCPSALVVLLGAIAQHQVALGLLLIVAFSVGLAATLMGLGLAVTGARGLTSRINFTSPLAAALPAASAVVIVAVGCLLTAQAIPQLV